MAALRVALDAYDDPQPEGDPIDLDRAEHRLRHVGRLLVGMRYADGLGELPNLLHHTYILAERAGSAGERGRSALHDAYRMAATLAGRFRMDVARRPRAGARQWAGIEL